MNSIDLNCDLGESFGHFTMGRDDEIFPYITSCNIACGFHGGDPFHIENTIKKAIKYDVQIGAHPSYPDLAGFGRRKMSLPAAELKASIKYQIAALKGMVESQGAELKYIKAHGALYNSIADGTEEADIFLEAVQEINPNLRIMGLAGSPFEEKVKRSAFVFIREGFLDRSYQKNGKLMSRAEEGAVLTSVERSVEQFKSIGLRQEVETATGEIIPMKVDSLCIHGDNPLAKVVLEAIHKTKNKNEISIKRFLL